MLKDRVEEFMVRRVLLVGVFRVSVRKDDVEGDLVGLIHHGSMAGGHFAGVEMQNAGNWSQVFFHAGQQFVGGARVIGVGPEYDNV